MGKPAMKAPETGAQQCQPHEHHKTTKKPGNRCADIMHCNKSTSPCQHAYRHEKQEMDAHLLFLAKQPGNGEDHEDGGRQR